MPGPDKAQIHTSVSSVDSGTVEWKGVMMGDKVVC